MYMQIYFYMWVQIVDLILNGSVDLGVGIQSAGEIKKKQVCVSQGPGVNQFR